MLSTEGAMANLPPPCHPEDLDPALTTRAAPVDADQALLRGSIKERPEDFLVEEVPLYQPAGTGEHVYLLIEKREMTTPEMVRIVAGHFGVAERAVGVAGMKDKHAITRQVVSIHTPGRTVDDFRMLEHPRLAVLWTDMHTNKLRLGHLAGNRFSIRIRGIDMTSVLGVRRALESLAQRGVPNLFDAQRFGTARRNHILGRLLLLGSFDALIEILRDSEPPTSRSALRIRAALDRGADARRAALAVEPGVRRIWLSAFQSALFNRVLSHRIGEGILDSLVEGDLAQKHENGAVFSVDRDVLDDPSTVERLRACEISPSGPMWGAKMTCATGAVGKFERELLDATGVTLERLRTVREVGATRLDGERRPLRVPLRDPEVAGGIDEHGHYVRCAFELPRGAYATTVMRQIIEAPDSSAGRTIDA